AFLGERYGRLDRRLTIDLSIRNRIAAEKAVAGCEPVIDACLCEVLAGRLFERELILAHAATERSAVGSRKQDVEVPRDRRVQLHRPAGQDAAARVVIGNSREPRDAQPLDESFIGAEEERFVAAQWTSQDAAEL